MSILIWGTVYIIFVDVKATFISVKIITLMCTSALCLQLATLCVKICVCVCVCVCV